MEEATPTTIVPASTIVTAAAARASPPPAVLASTTDDAAEREQDQLLVALWTQGRPANTARAYRQDIAQFFAFTRRPLKCTGLVQLQAYGLDLERRGLSSATRRRMLAAVKSLFKYAAGDGIRHLQINFAAALRLPRVKDTLAERILTEQQVGAMIAAAKPGRDRFLILFAYRTAARVEELVSLRWRDAHATTAGAGVLTIFGKGEKTRHVALGPAEWDLLETQRPTDGSGTGDDFIIHGRGGGLSAAQAWRIVRAAARGAGITAHVSPHWLRHAHATHAIDRGADIRIVQATLGHSSVSTTEHYIHCRPKQSSGAFLPPLPPSAR
jgi:integrase/recombinase XerD